MTESIVGGLVVAVLVALGAAFRDKIATLFRRRNPIEVTVTRMVGDEWTVALSGKVPDDISQLKGQVPSRDVHERLLEAGAADNRETQVRLSLRGLANDTVVIRDIRAKVERALPLAGTRVYCATAGANSATLLAIDLDHDDSPAWGQKEDGSQEPISTSPYFETHNITLAKGEVHDVIVVGHAKESFARWTIVLHLSVGKRNSALELTDSGHPFKTSGDHAGGFFEKLEWAWDLGGEFISERTWGVGG